MARCKLRPFKPATFSSMSSTGWYQVPRFSGQGILVRLWHATDTGMLKFTEVRSSTASTIHKYKSEESSKYKHACAHTHARAHIYSHARALQPSERENAKLLSTKATKDRCTCECGESSTNMVPVVPLKLSRQSWNADLAPARSRQEDRRSDVGWQNVTSIILLVARSKTQPVITVTCQWASFKNQSCHPVKSK